MKHNKWFEETFLPSLKNGQWLSEKQVSVCKKYMEEDRYWSWSYTLKIKNMKYRVSVSKKGYGKFYIEEFPYNIEYDDGSYDQWVKELHEDVQRRIAERKKITC